MAKADKKNEGEAAVEAGAEKESVASILGKIRSIVSGKDKVSLEEDKAEVAAESSVEEEVLEASAQSEGVEDDVLELIEIVDEEVEARPLEVEESIEQKLEEVAEEVIATGATDNASEENFVDILQEIDQALEKEYNPEGKVAEENVPAAQVAAETVVEVAAPVEEVVMVEEVAEVVAQPQEEVKNEEPAALEDVKTFDAGNSENIMADGAGDANGQTNEPEVKPMTEKKIISQEIAARSSKAIQEMLTKIPGPDIDSPAFRSANTLEDVVVEMLRPMLSSWLDKNLETIVRDIVEKEIKKIIPRD